MIATGSPSHKGSTAHHGHASWCLAGGIATAGFSPSPPPSLSIMLLTRIEHMQSHTSKSEVLSKVSHNSVQWSAPVHVIDDQRRITGEEDRDNQLCFWSDDFEIMSSYILSESTGYWIHGTRVVIQRGYANRMYQRYVYTEYDPEHYLEIPNEADWFRTFKAEYDSESASAIQRYKISTLNEMPSQHRRSRHTDATAKINVQINTLRSHMRLVFGGGMTFKRDGANYSRVKYPYHELSTYRKYWNHLLPSAFTNTQG